MYQSDSKDETLGKLYIAPKKVNDSSEKPNPKEKPKQSYENKEGENYETNTEEDDDADW